MQDAQVSVVAFGDPSRLGNYIFKRDCGLVLALPGRIRPRLKCHLAPWIQASLLIAGEAKGDFPIPRPEIASSRCSSQ